MMPEAITSFNSVIRARYNALKGAQQRYYFLFALALLVIGLMITVVVILMGIKPKLGQITSDHKEANINYSAFNSAIGDLNHIVATYTPPINESAHAPEFRTKEWIVDHVGEGTLQVMNVDNERTIKEYLASRPDRTLFYYFKILQNKQARYILIYKLFPSKQLAAQNLKYVQFNLPENIQAFAELMDNYINVAAETKIAKPKLSTESDVQKKLTPKQQPLSEPAIRPDEADAISAQNTTAGSTSTSNIKDPQNTTSAIAIGSDTPIIKEQLTPKENKLAQVEKPKQNEAKETSSKASSEPKETVTELPAVSDPF